MSKVGTSSDYGKQLLIGRVPQKDQILYQTERYHTSTFGYDIPITEDGRYLLVLKFSEVYFNAPNMKVSLVTKPEWTKQMEQILNFQVPAEGLELVILLHTQ